MGTARQEKSVWSRSRVGRVERGFSCSRSDLDLRRGASGNDSALITCFATHTSTHTFTRNKEYILYPHTTLGDCSMKRACSTLAQDRRSSSFSLEKKSSLKLNASILAHSNCDRLCLSDLGGKG
jgi:hypothetical protein